MGKVQTMFKVVYTDAWGVKTSCTIKTGKSCIDYETDKWTAKRKYGPLVFATQERALGFLSANFIGARPYVRHSSCYEVWECDAENVHQCDRVLPVDQVLDLNNETVRRHMDGVAQSFGAYNAMWAPSGTFMASRIRLTRKVW